MRNACNCGFVTQRSVNTSRQRNWPECGYPNGSACAYRGRRRENLLAILKACEPRRPIMEGLP